MENRIENIIIAGGGISGWLSALFLDKFLNSQDKVCSITVIESEDLANISFEEASLSGFRAFLQILEINEYDFIVNTDATFKLAIKFVNWSGSGEEDIFWHPFSGRGPLVGEFPMIDWWLKKKLNGKVFKVTADYFSSLNTSLAGYNKAPKLITEKRNFVGEVPYAYHMNANLAALYLSKIGRKRGIKVIADEIINVKVNTQGFISQLQTKSNGAVTGDLFIDCSGFKGLLLNKALKEPFIPDSVFCDSAVIVKFPMGPDDKKILPYMTATTLSSGWVWHKPLFSSYSYGYVYSSSYISKDKAEKELLAFLGKKAGEGETKHIKMRVGRAKNPWRKNCIAIGPAAGFIEPLESTGIQMIEMGLRALLFNFPDKSFNPSLAKNYNVFMSARQQHIVDFILLHYYLARRSDTKFWKEIKIKLKLTESLKEDLELLEKVFFDFRAKPSTIANVFTRESYLYILAGLGYLPKSSWTLLNYKELDGLAYQTYLNEIQNNPLKKSLPDQYQYLLKLHKTHKAILF
jgi:hypothetical protein